MCNNGFKEYVNGNMLFWACDVNSAEGYRGINKAMQLSYVNIGEYETGVFFKLIAIFKTMRPPQTKFMVVLFAMDFRQSNKNFTWICLISI